MSATIIDLASYRSSNTGEAAALFARASRSDVPLRRIANGMRGLAEALRDLRDLRAEQTRAE